eukprot:TRINITY_DN3621_c0_g1_i1.p2 TRINITY_DN3621_c0_g1~~TRINITY_DN3621_c0_g1_i1.p2  ORF type:complete len:156 (+),score=61.68 TRINITY_DN3621_c0_g1_i1:28-495(+)
MKYMVAVDGSSHAQKALQMAYRFVGEGDELVILSVGNFQSNRLREFFDEAGVAEAKTKALAGVEKLVNETMEHAQSRGIAKVTGKAELGHPRTVIVELAEKENVDMIIMGARGLGAVERLVIGSVSDYVMKHANADVLIAKGDIPVESEVIVDDE